MVVAAAAAADNPLLPGNLNDLLRLELGRPGQAATWIDLSSRAEGEVRAAGSGPPPPRQGHGDVVRGWVGGRRMQGGRKGVRESGKEGDRQVERKGDGGRGRSEGMSE